MVFTQDKISRSCLVGRWVAEGLLPLRVVEPPLTTMEEEAGESHLKSICKVTSLKYLSLRNTDVSSLPKKMEDLWQLETLDIRDTKNMPATAMRRIYLHNLKHLLAGDNISTDGGGEGKKNESDSTVLVPHRIGKKTETSRHVRIKDGQADLARIGSLEQLRKLGVVLDGSEVISKRRDTLRSLSVWITEPPPPPPPAAEHMAGDDVFVTLDHSQEEILAPSKLESLDLKCFFKGGNGGDNRGYKLPTWINEKLQALSKITLRYTLLREDGLRILGKLKSLRCLRLLRKAYIEREVTLEEGEFGELRLLLLDHVSVKTALIKARAAPKLEKIVWNLDKTRTLVTISPDGISRINNTPLLCFEAADAAAPKLEKVVDWNFNSTKKITLDRPGFNHIPVSPRGSSRIHQIRELKIYVFPLPRYLRCFITVEGDQKVEE
uniref:Disease resistance R13L4/SHOC-2-like LRR domain-containing protein n=1 Tax=Oryza barthii TaxID=65489 RepID=A0A0D3HPI3_9ORYZ